MTTKFETSMGSTTTSTAPRGPASTPTPTQKPANAKVSMIARRLRLPDFSSMRRRRAIIDTLALAGFWVGVGVLAGPRGAVLVVVLPMLVSNFVVMSYIVTNHMLCPMAPSRDTLNTTLSVPTHKILVIAHFHFSHPLEHHLFLAMSRRY